MIEDAIAPRPRLLVVTTTYPRWRDDTWPSFVHELASRLTDHYEIVVLTQRSPGASDQEKMDDVLIKRFPYLTRNLELLSGNDGVLQTLRLKPWLVILLPLFLVGMMLGIRKEVKNGARLIHAHWIPWGFLATIAVPGIPVLVTAHGSDVFKLRGGFWKMIRRITSRRVKAVATVSKLLSDSLIDEGVEASKLFVAPMGVDLKNKFTPILVASAKTMDFIFVGRLIDSKGPDLLINAMQMVHVQIPFAKLLVVGDGPMGETLKARVHETGLEGVVEFTGAMTNDKVAEMMAKSRVCVMTGRASSDGVSEGLGLVAIEALGAGCRLVSVNNPALQGMLPAGVPATFIDPIDVAAFASAMIAEIKKDPSEMDKGFPEFRRQVIDTFDWENVASNYCAILQKICQ